MNKTEMKKYLMNLYESAHDSMMKNRKCEKLYEQYYGERQQAGRILVDCGFMTRLELQEFLDHLNLGYDF